MSDAYGRPVWYELACTPSRRPDAEAFYADLFGWQIADSGMEGFEYDLASADGDMVAGIMDMPADRDGANPFWLIYFSVADADAATAAAVEAGASVQRPPADIPGTGRFAILEDPQGAAFGLLAPVPMDDGAGGQAFDQTKAAHGNWTELASKDPAAAIGFYTGLLGWTKSAAFDMGGAGDYQLFAHGGGDIGGIAPRSDSEAEAWLPYFGIAGVSAAIDRIGALGGNVIFGPQEVPGGAHIAIAEDPQGARFAVVGPLDTPG